MVERWQIRKWECPVVFSWFPVGVSFIAFICYSVGVCIYMYVGDCVCGEKVVVVVVVELSRRRRKMSSVYVFGCDIHCRSFSIHIYQSLL